MSQRDLVWIRWAAVVPCALFATVIVQIGSETVFTHVLLTIVGIETWAPWAARSLASLFMGAVFVFTAQALAPRAKIPVCALSVVAVIVWALVLAIGSEDQGNFGWIVVMGISGVTGAFLATGLALKLAEPQSGQAASVHKVC